MNFGMKRSRRGLRHQSESSNVIRDARTLSCTYTNRNNNTSVAVPNGAPYFRIPGQEPDPAANLSWIDNNSRTGHRFQTRFIRLLTLAANVSPEPVSSFTVRILEYPVRTARTVAAIAIGAAAGSASSVCVVPAGGPALRSFFGESKRLLGTVGLVVDAAITLSHSRNDHQTGHRSGTAWSLPLVFSSPARPLPWRFIW